MTQDINPSSRTTRRLVQPRRLLPRGSPVLADGEPSSKPKSKKSRNGCATCKARRRKCDEAKPSCRQCVRRSVTCDGYTKDLRWKEFQKPEHTTTSSHDETPRRPICPPISRKPDDSRETTRSSELQDDALHKTRSEYGVSETVDSESPPPDTAETVPNPNFRSESPWFIRESDPEVDISFDISPSPLGELGDLDALFSGTNAADALDDQFPLQPVSRTRAAERDGTTRSSTLLPFDAVETADVLGSPGQQSETPAYHDGWEMTPRSHSFGSGHQTPNLSFRLTLPCSSRGVMQDMLQGIFPLYHQPHIHSDSPESVALLFDRRICELLSIKDDPTGNPWRTIVWPLAKEHPALYHAIAAMTFFQGFNNRPRFRAQGIRHLERSMQSLSAGDSSGMRLEVVLTVTVALAFAQTWSYPRSSTAIRHIEGAKVLLQKAFSMHLSSQVPERNQAALNFLANTWMYMDVLARITCHSIQALDVDFMTARNLDNLTNDSGPEIDHLMGFAGTLFPWIGRVADVVSRVWRTPEKPNSLTIISRAVALRAAIEQWNPPINSLGPIEGESLTSHTSDLIQTANAYRWATLLLLHQAVPELPSRIGFSEMAQNVLILLATVPLTSRTIAFQILPLLMAGCETTEPEDRDWVLERWQSQSAGNTSGIVERCLELTKEVWRRRDNHKKHCAPGHLCGVETPATSLPCSIFGATDSNASFEQRGIEGRSVEEDCLCGFENGRSTIHTGKMDPRTRLKCVEFTIMSKFHWLSIMKEWGWEVLLG